MASDQEVEDQRDRVLELRAQLEEARTGGADVQKELDNEIYLTQLKTEEAKLLAEIAEVNQQSNPQAVVRGAASTLGTVQEQMAAAVAHQKAVADAVTLQNKADAPVAPVVPATDKAVKINEKVS